MPAPRKGAFRLRQVTRLRRSYTTTRAYVRSMTPSVTGLLPSIVIIGSQRGGTTALFRYLAEHPQVVAPRSKELNALSLHYDKGEGWYRGHFPTTSESVRALEASPLYLADPRVPARAAARLPHAHFIALLRNPVERAYSHYLHNLEYGFEQLSFVDALDAEGERLLEADRRGLGSRRGMEIYRNFSYVLRGCYASQIEQWQMHVPPSRLTVLRSEDFFADPKGTYDDLLRRLDLDPHDGVAFTRINHGDDDAQTQLTDGVRRRLEEEFAESNARLTSLLGWSDTWSKLIA